MAISKIVAVAQDSKNEKITRKDGPKVSATYVSQKTCPSTCPFKDNGCYAEKGHVRYTLNRLEKITQELNLSRTDLAIEEARGIDALKANGQVLRIHVVGDCSTRESAKIVSAAADRFSERGGGKVWTYTHAWKHVNRGSWGKVSVLASLQDTKEGKKALERGYAPAVVVDAFPNGGKAFEENGVKWIPCREQVAGTPCTECKLCFDAETLKRLKRGIAFAQH